MAAIFIATINKKQFVGAILSKLFPGCIFQIPSVVFGFTSFYFIFKKEKHTRVSTNLK